jgi:hypothetical protein
MRNADSAGSAENGESAVKQAEGVTDLFEWRFRYR